VSLERASLSWHGWGRPERAVRHDPAREAWLLGELERRLGGRGPGLPAPARPGHVKLPSVRLGDEDREALRRACLPGSVSSDDEARLRCATGRSLPDLLRLRLGELERAPDAVARPGSEEAVLAVLRWAEAAGVAVVPVGGATSVTGGVEALCGPGQRACVALDTTGLDAFVDLDLESGLATFQAGVDGPALEAALAARGLTLGHFPQSFEFSTLGGWIATRSSGQQSNGYGSIEDLVVSVRVATPRGVLSTLAVPRSAAGPDLRRVVAGSEGVLGVIVEATLRVRPAPVRADDRGMLFRSFGDGVAAVRDMVRGGLGLGLLRLADGPETELGLVQRRDPTRRLDPVDALLGLLARAGYGEGRSLLLYGAEGPLPSDVGARMRRASRLGRARGGLALGRKPGRSWRHERFAAPYLRDWLLDRGVAVDTFESAFPWSRIEDAHASVTAALRRAAEREAGGGLVMAHLSHSYPDGACLYFTLLYPLAADRALSQWAALKHAATEAIVGAGGTLSHHHGVGADHRPWLAGEIGEPGLAVLRGVRGALDPAGLMNPGKLL